MNKQVRTLLVIAAVAVVGGLTSAEAAAQADPLPLDRETITSFAHVHVSVNDARDEFHGKVGRVHDDEGRRRAREELEDRLAEIFVAAEVTHEWYDAMILAISMDGEARAIFDEVLAEIEGD